MPGERMGAEWNTRREWRRPAVCEQVIVVSALVLYGRGYYDAGAGLCIAIQVRAHARLQR